MKFSVIVLSVGLVQAARACDICAMYAASEAHAEIGRGIFAGVAEQFTHFGTVQVDGHEVGNPSGQYLDSSISQLFVGYNFNSRLGLQFNLPVIARWYKRPDNAGGIERGSETGLGDSALLGHATFYRSSRPNWTINWRGLVGLKFPTGSSDRIKEELNEVEEPAGPPSGIHGHDLTRGSGSFDGIVGTGLFCRWHRGFFTFDTQYAIRSQGDFDYRFANDLTWAAGPGFYAALTDDYTIGLQAIVSGEHKEKDRFRGANAEDTGITAAYVGPEVNITWHNKLSARLGLDFPVVIENTALQTVADYHIRVSVNWRF